MDVISNGKGANTPYGAIRLLEPWKPFLGIRRFLMVWPGRFAAIFRSRESVRNEQLTSNNTFSLRVDESRVFYEKTCPTRMLTQVEAL